MGDRCIACFQDNQLSSDRCSGSLWRLIDTSIRYMSRYTPNGVSHDQMVKSVSVALCAESATDTTRLHRKPNVFLVLLFSKRPIVE